MPFFKCNPTYYSLELPYGIMEKQVILIIRHLNLYRRTETKMEVRKNSVNCLLIFTFIIEMNVNQYYIWWSFFFQIKENALSCISKLFLLSLIL